MARVLYLDCFSGISGDMMLGAALDAGLPLDALRSVVQPLLGDGWALTVSTVMRAGITATKFSVQPAGGDTPPHEEPRHAHDAHAHDHGHHHEPGQARLPGHASHAHGHRTLSEIYTLIDRSALTSEGRRQARSMFERLGAAEAAIHGVSIDAVHLHEVGSLDSIVDIVGAVCAVQWFAADRIICSPLNVGGGMVDSAHGRFPVPAPATLRVLGSAPVYSGDVREELVTPTGALIATTFADAFGPLPAMRILQIGYGAGDRNPPATPNVLRVLVGEDGASTDGESIAEHEAAGREVMTRGSDRVAVVECEIDDMNPQLFGPVMDRLHQVGALDVYYTPIQMKKGRPAILVTVLARPADREAVAETLFRETTTIGLRYHVADRVCLVREVVRVSTSLGDARVKRALHHGVEVNASPEFDDCVALAASSGMAIKDVQGLVMQAYREAREHQS